MDWGNAGGRAAALAAVVLAVLALVSIPLAAADPAPGPLADVDGPSVSDVSVSPTPVTDPNPVTVLSLATDAQSNVLMGEFFIDVPGPQGTSTFRLTAADGAANNPVEWLAWSGTYATFSQGLTPGLHTLYVHAIDFVGNWGPFAILEFPLGDPLTSGPVMMSLDLTPADVPTGVALTVSGTASDGFRNGIAAAEFFVDAIGADGTGTPMDPGDGSFGGPAEPVTWTGILAATPGVHPIYAHARSVLGTWGLPAAAPFTARAPAFTVQVDASPADAAPGETVTFALTLENTGNDPAVRVWLNLTLAPVLAYVDDTAASAGGVRTGGTRYEFSDVAGSVSFSLRASVVPTATDGIDLAVQAQLDFTNGFGWDFAAVSTGTAGTVVASELAVTFLAPALAYAGETAVFTVGIQNTGIRAVPGVDVTLTAPMWTVVESDSAASEGGARIGEGVWRFANLTPGAHAFQITVRISLAATDGLSLHPSVSVAYVSRLGDPVQQIASDATTVQRPAFSLAVTSDRPEAALGEPVTLSVLFPNLGSASARFVRVHIVLPSGFAIVGGDPPTAAAGPERTWEFAKLAPGPHGITVLLEGRTAGRASFLVELVYESPNGEAFPAMSAPVTVLVRAPSSLLGGMTAGLAVASTTLALGAFLATERGKSAFFLMFIPLYSRLQKEHVLDHETRG
ncbi:MAG TPA: hypothetical protein VGR51_07160, partial [Thermoplasmata archaeon]|nr:hypothetical protein [Thermoplasmata archaeon]